MSSQSPPNFPSVLQRTESVSPSRMTYPEHTPAAEAAPIDLHRTAPAEPAKVTSETIPMPTALVESPPPDAGFVPVPTRLRLDGWTPERQRAFVEALADTGCVDTAAAQVGMSVQSAYRLRRRPDAGAFDTAWRAAMAHAANRLVDVAFTRALNGTVEDVYYHGEKVGERRRYSDRLLLATMNFREDFYFNPDVEPTQISENFRLLPDIRRVIGDMFAAAAEMISPSGARPKKHRGGK
jgi:hypothetical protein